MSKREECAIEKAAPGVAETTKEAAVTESVLVEEGGEKPAATVVPDVVENFITGEKVLKRWLYHQKRKGW